LLIFAAGVTAGLGLLAAGQPGLALIAFGVPMLVLLPVLAALWTRRVVILDGREKITWRAAQRAYENADRLAAQVLTLFPDEDPRDALRRARMELARLLAERRRLRVAWREATTAGHGLAVGDPLRDQALPYANNEAAGPAERSAAVLDAYRELQADLWRTD
jgi:hypothetical protein